MVPIVIYLTFSLIITSRNNTSVQRKLHVEVQLLDLHNFGAIFSTYKKAYAWYIKLDVDTEAYVDIYSESFILSQLRNGSFNDMNEVLNLQTFANQMNTKGVHNIRDF